MGNPAPEEPDRQSYLRRDKDNWRVTADRMRFDDIDLLRLSNRERRKLIGHNVSMIFQSPSRASTPLSASASS